MIGDLWMSVMLVLGHLTFVACLVLLGMLAAGWRAGRDERARVSGWEDRQLPDELELRRAARRSA